MDMDILVDKFDDISFRPQVNPAGALFFYSNNFFEILGFFLVFALAEFIQEPFSRNKPATRRNIPEKIYPTRAKCDEATNEARFWRVFRLDVSERNLHHTPRENAIRTKPIQAVGIPRTCYQGGDPWPRGLLAVAMPVDPPAAPVQPRPEGGMGYF